MTKSKAKRSRGKAQVPLATRDVGLQVFFQELEDEPQGSRGAANIQQADLGALLMPKQNMLRSIITMLELPSDCRDVEPEFDEVTGT